METPRLDVRPCLPRFLASSGLARGACVLALTAAGATGAGAQPDGFVPREVIVKFVPATLATEAVALRSSVDATVKRRFSSIDAELWEIAGIGVPDAVVRLQGDRRIAFIEPNYIVQATDVFPNDPRFVAQWSLHNVGQSGGRADADIDAPEAWSIETGGDVLVGVIDTGVDWHHPDLAANIFVNPSEIADNRLDDDGNGFIDDVRGWDFVNEDNDPGDDNGHGTHVAGTMAAVGNNGVGIAGVTWSARILPLKFLSSIGTGSTADAIRAIEYATAMGARVTNNSWGGVSFSLALRLAIEAAGDANVLFVAAAGNNGINTDAAPYYPSGFDLHNVIAVGSTDHNDQRSAFSNYGATSVDLFAPGADIVSTFPGDRYAIASGTSMAAPHVAGAVALVWAAEPALAPHDVKGAILASADAVPALQGLAVTGGRLNLDRMLSQLDDVPPSAVGDLAVVATGSNTASLSWTASGDDGDSRTASRYDLRYSQAPIDAGNFESTDPATGVPVPKAPGSLESFEVGGLDFNTTYHFRLVVEDERGNRSAISNATSATTLGIPRLEFEPASFAAGLLTGGVSEQTLEVRNGAEGTLDFSIDSALLPAWLRLEPVRGRVPAGEKRDVRVTLDATRMATGDYAATIGLACNDPAAPSAAIVVSLRVTSAPDVAAAPASIDYGTRYTGTCATDTVVISNIGAEALVVSGVEIANPEFTSDGLGFVLAVGETRSLAVEYCPLAEEIVPGIPRQYPRRSRGVVVLATNDPDHPTFSVPLFGDAIDPPVVSVVPASFSENLVTGGVADRMLTVSNQGASDLDFEIALEEIGAAGVRVDALAGLSLADGVVAVGRPLAPEALASLAKRVPPAVVMGAPAGVDERTPARARARGPRALERVPAGDLAEVFGSDQNEYLGGPRTRGNLFTCTTPTTLREHRFYMNPTVPTQVWFVVYEGEEQTGVYRLISASDLSPAGPGLGWYSSGPVAVPLRAGRFYLIATAFEDAAAYYNELDVTPYPIPASFGELTAGAGWTWQPYDQFPPAPFQFVTSQAFTDPVAYYQTLITGGAIRWLSVESPAGSVAPGTSLDIAIRFDAAGVAGGDYEAVVRVASNDPATPALTIPASVRVTGAPDIAVSESELDFGAVFVGTAARDTLVVSNTGTEFLFVSAVTSSHPAYTVDSPSFALGPGTRRPVVVTFAPTAAGTAPATLSIASIDPDEGTVPVALHGDAREAPIVSVEPSAISIDLDSGETGVRTLTIANAGGSDLEFEIETGLASARVGSPPLSVSRSTGDFPRGAHAASIGPAPTRRDPRRPDQPAAAGARAAGRFAFATETQNRTAARLDLGAPETLRLIGSAPELIWAGDFGVGDNSFAYALNEVNALVRVDTLTGAQTPLGTIAPLGSEVWSGMALDPTDGTLYASSTDARSSSLYVIDVEARSATRIGAMFFPAIVALAVDDDGVMYAQDVITDELVAVDKATGRGTAIGSLGFDANFGQGMAFDPESEQLYLAAFNNFRFQSELRIADRATGATTVVGVLGGLDPGGLVQLGWLGIPGLGGVPWLRANPRRGVVAPGGTFEVEMRFDAGALNGGDYDASVRVVSNDPLAPEVALPVHLRVTGRPEIAASDSLLDFGDVFIGGAGRRTLTVANVGTDALHVSGVSAQGDYAVDGSAFALAPGGTRDLAVTLAPTSLGPLSGTLTISSDDDDEGTLAVALHGAGRAPPVMTVTPPSFDEQMATGERVRRTLTIDNSAGAAGLVWNASARYAGDARAVRARSRAYRARPLVDPHKDAGRPPQGRPAAADIFVFPPLARAPSISPASVDATGLETILESLDARFGDVTAAIPNRFDFFDGKVSNGILDGGYDMFDGGNYLSTNFGALLPYSDGVIAAGSYFGAGGRYFTRKYPGLFVLVAETDGVEYFEVNGNLGADGFGVVDGAILEARTAGADFRGFVKRVSGAAGDPSVNHIIIVQENDAARHEFATDTNSDYHRAFDLAGGRRLYYLLYAGWDGAYIDDAATLNIMTAFLHSLGLSPPWVRIAPAAGVVPAGAVASAEVAFDAAGLVGDFDAHVVVAGNDPLLPEVAVPAHMAVVAAPDIALSRPFLNFPATFVGAGASDSFVVSNVGSDVLIVSAVASGTADYSADEVSFAIAPGESRTVTVTFAPTAPGLRASLLTIANNDPDESNAAVVLLGQGLEAPVVSISPGAIADTLATGASSVHALTIANAGGNALDLRVTIEGARPAPGARAASGGGPDFAGYRWEDSRDPAGPGFAWIDAAAGADVALSADGFVEHIPLGFEFRYYGSVFSSLTVGANGWLSFNGSGLSYPAFVPRLDFVAGAIAPYARDLSPPDADFVRYLTIGNAPDRRFVVEYSGIPDAGGGHRKTFQVILYERTDAIRFQYLVAPNAPEGFGIESPDESLGLGNGGEGDAFIDPARVADGYAIEFIAPPHWLRVDPVTASVPPGGSVELGLVLDAAGLAGGRYDGRLSVRSNDPSTPVAEVAVTLTVDAPLAITTAVAPALPERYQLHANRPNPFNPITTIAYDLPRASEVRLAVYDVRGREVRVLVSARKAAGRHQAAWDGRDARGEPAASGVYFYRLVAGAFVHTKKMVLLK